MEVDPKAADASVLGQVGHRRNLQPSELPSGFDNARGYTYGVQVGNMVWTSGQVPLDEAGNLVGRGDVEAQAVQVMENLKRVIEVSGGTLDDVVKITTYVADRSYREAVQAVRRRYFRAPNFPASATTVVGMLQTDMLVEVEAVAVIGSGLR